MAEYGKAERGTPTVVSHILSFLPKTKEAASTSVLAKRWRNLFAFVPSLDLDDSDFLSPKRSKREKDGAVQCFMDFVDRVLALQDVSPIKAFSLKVKTGVDPYRVDRWILNVLRRGVSHLGLFLEFKEDYSLPYEISVSKTLVELKTGYGVDLDAWDDDMFLPMLKTLVLDTVKFGRGQFQTLLPACPALEELELLDMVWRDRNVIISSSRLKYLKITSEDGSLGTFSLDAPNLVVLDYGDFAEEDYPLLNLQNVVQVELNFPHADYRGDRARENVRKLIHSIRKAKMFHISPRYFELLSFCLSNTMPVREKLTVLHPRTLIKPLQGWQAMPLLLRNSPHLEILFFEDLLHLVTQTCGDVCDCLSTRDKGRSLMSSPVKKIFVSRFRGTIREVHMIKHFLNYCPSLEEMEITPERDEPTMLEIPRWLGVVEDTLMHYNETSSCNVIFWVPDVLYRKWIRQWSLRG
ncbi:unnamed protein product [Microthlaspi erraticum]|uniref:FBD domain-containing protein n=1 Tax=Microthlaspi erraticum TaxID=1685480 RepID=A0A6D2HMW5_9BRAS|nr:unnamed protein product [Microthlaspi erraticum]CAA7059132.1 unnamed protein product [Microthlaspi erraticum]